MTHFTPAVKHSILVEYRPRDKDRSFEALAARHEGVTAWTISRWYHIWDGTPESLEEGDRPGRPPLIDPVERNQLIHTVIDQANRHYEPVHYPQVRDAIIEQTHVHPSIRTVQSWGHQLRARQVRAIPRTEGERTSIYTIIIILHACVHE